MDKIRRKEDFMDFYNTIYNAVYLYLIEKREYPTGVERQDAIDSLCKKYMAIIEEPLDDAIHDALVELEGMLSDQDE